METIDKGKRMIQTIEVEKLKGVLDIKFDIKDLIRMTKSHLENQQGCEDMNEFIIFFKEEIICWDIEDIDDKKLYEHIIK